MNRIAAFFMVIFTVISAGCGHIPGTPTPVKPTPVSLTYYFQTTPSEPVAIPGSVVILPDMLILSPIVTSQNVSPGSEAVRMALEMMMDDPHNSPVVGDLQIDQLALTGDSLEIALLGEVHAAGDIVLIAIRWMILLTVFDSSSIDTAHITLNGQNIANLGVSWSGNALPEDYGYTRSEIETFKQENALIGQ